MVDEAESTNAPRAGWRLPALDGHGGIVEPELHDGTLLGARAIGSGQGSEVRLYFRCARGLEYEFSIRPGDRALLSEWAPSNFVNSLRLVTGTRVPLEQVRRACGPLSAADDVSLDLIAREIERGRSSLFVVKPLVGGDFVAIVRHVEYRRKTSSTDAELVR